MQLKSKRKMDKVALANIGVNAFLKMVLIDNLYTEIYIQVIF